MVIFFTACSTAKVRAAPTFPLRFFHHSMFDNARSSRAIAESSEGPAGALSKACAPKDVTETSPPIRAMLSRLVLPRERVLVLEDARELQLQLDHVVQLATRPADARGEGAVTIRALFNVPSFRRWWCC
jgi:hypothetical protein